jgi:hypothetical protein
LLKPPEIGGFCFARKLAAEAAIFGAGWLSARL